MKVKIVLLLILFAFAYNFNAQNSDQLQNATLTGAADYMIEVPSIASQIAAGTFIPAEYIEKEVNPKKRGANRAVPGKGLPRGNDPLWEQQSRTTLVKGREPILTFEAASSGTTPTDPTGAVGPNHFVNAWNSSFRIWDKSGNALTDAASLGTIFPGQTMGDPIVFYDAFADRFLITEFFSNGFLVAISQGSDPVNDGWYTYQYSTSSFPDYPKFSVWSDGYYITANKDQGSPDVSEVVFAIERDEIILGNPDAQIVGFPLPDIVNSGFYSPLGFNVNGSELPPAGDSPIVYMQDDSWSGISEDHLKIWRINVDWDDPENSTISDPEEIITEAFDGLFDGGSFSNLPQPSGPDIDALQATIMYMAQYRRFSSFNSVVFNFVVDLDGNDDYAGIRWYELRQTEDGDPWAIYQEGTYVQPDGHSAFVGNMCMDVNGNIAMAYSVVSSTEYPSLRYTGRFVSDELNTMTIAEEVIVNGVQSDPSLRYGDYSQMTIDPTDDKTFWSIGEYFAGGTRKNQVGVFKLAPDLPDDVGVVSIDAPVDGSLSSADTVKITIRNFGIDTQVDIPVSYQVDGGTIVNEIFTDSLHGSTSAQYIFSTTGDFSVEGQTYWITAYTSMSTDQDNSNDTLTTSVTHLFPNDIGVTKIISPVSGSGLTTEEPVKVTIGNFGGAKQSDFDITYFLDEGTPITEQVPDTLPGSSTMTYTFDQAADLSLLGDYTLMVYTSLSGDSDMTNDTINEIITNEICQPEQNCNEGDGIAVLKLGTIENNSGCDPNGYGDYTYLITDLELGFVNKLTITTNYGDQYVKVWIDYNDNFLFENNEMVVDDYVIAPGQGAGTYMEEIDLIVGYEASLGEHMMRAKTNWNSGVPDDACEETSYGETEDYTVNLVQTTGVNELTREPNELIIGSSSDDRFKLSFTAVNLSENLILTVHNTSGQKVIQNWVYNNGGKYEYDFDMSHAPPGVYLVRLGSSNFGKVKKIVVN